jgi:hypothetical protein
MNYHLHSCPGFCAGCSGEFLAERKRVSDFLFSLRTDAVLLSFAASILDKKIQSIPAGTSQAQQQGWEAIADM